jgi:uncharacterized damage-inducible protein DinB
MDTSEQGAAAGLTQEERAHVIRLLRESADEFLELISNLTDAQRTRETAPGGWSAQQIAEHLVLGEKAMLGKIKEALASPASLEWEEQDARKTRFLGLVGPGSEA